MTNLLDVENLLKKYDQITNSYFTNNPIEKFNQEHKQRVDDYNGMVENFNKDADQAKKELAELDAQIRNQQALGIVNDSTLIEKYNGLVEEHNRRFHNKSGELERQKIEIDNFRKNDEKEVELYKNWLKEKGPEKFFTELNQLYVTLIQNGQNSSKQEGYIKKLRELREFIGAAAKNEQDRIEDGALLVQATLCETEKCFVSIANGASVVAISPEMAKILKLEEYIGEEVEVILAGGVTISAPQVLVPDISYEDHHAKFVKAVILKQPFPGVDGCLGLSFLNRFDFRIEGKNPKKLTLQQISKQESIQEFDVFISHKTNDFNYAKEVHELLSKSGHRPFLSEFVLQNPSSNIFSREIEKALDSAKHLILVCSLPENVKSGWVEAEWRLFDDLIKSGEKQGKVIPLICGNMVIEKLPKILRVYQILSMNDPNWRTTLLNTLCR